MHIRRGCGRGTSGLFLVRGDAERSRVSKMYNEVSGKNKEILIYILSKRPKNNLQQHLKGQASKYHPPPSPRRASLWFSE